MVIAAFDFDGTINTKDTLFGFLSFAFGRRKLLRALAILSPVLILHKIKLVSNHKAKERLFAHFFAGMDLSRYRELCERYAAEIDKILNPAIMEQLAMHQAQNAEIIIVSASVADWIKPWAKQHGIEKVIATEAEVKNDRLTGRFSNKNCYGPEKVNRLLATFPNKETYQLYAYGDSKGDRELLALADFAFYRYKGGEDRDWQVK